MEDKDFYSKIKEKIRFIRKKVMGGLVFKLIVISLIIIFLIAGFLYLLNYIAGILDESDPGNVFPAHPHILLL